MCFHASRFSARQANEDTLVLLGELYKNFDNAKARSSFQKARSLAKTQTEKQNIQAKIDGLA